MTAPSSDSFKDTQSKVTPYAFSVAPQVLDMPLAKPWRRCTAILLDLTFIGIASESVSDEVGILMLLIMWLARRYMSNTQFKRIAAIAIMVIFIGNIGYAWLTDDNASHTAKASTHNTLEAAQALQLLPEMIAVEQCDAIDDSQCTDEAISALNTAAEQADIAPEIVTEIIGGAANEPHSTTPIIEANVTLDSDPHTDTDTEHFHPNHYAHNTPLHWLQGALADLGLRFSWAALYFTLFCAWFDGKTPGKALLGIRVIHLDGKPMTIWSAFGRYGGYGAGIATGLLGFLQIYWDPNRQAIQDKISATAVIRG